MRKPLLIALVALPVLGVGGYFGLTAYVNHLARSEVLSALGTLRGAGAQASVGEVKFNLFTRRFELHDLSVIGPAKGELKIGTLVANGVEQRDAGRVFVATAQISDVTADIPQVISTPGITRYHAPLVEITALSVPGQAPVDGSPARIALDFFRSITAERIDIPASTGTGSTGEGATLVKNEESNGAIRLDGLANGRFATVTGEPSRLTFTGQPEFSGHGSVGKVDIKGFDIAGMLVLLDPEQREASDQFITIHDAVTIDGYAFTLNNGLSYRTAKMSMTGVAIRPAAIPLEELSAAGQQLQTIDRTGAATPPPEEMAPIFRTAAAAFDEGVRFGGFAIEGLDVTAPGGIAFSLGAFTLGAVEGGRIDSLTLDTLTGTGPEGKSFKMGRFALGGLRAGTLMTLMADTAEHPAQVGRWPAPFFNTLESLSIDKLEAPTEEGSPLDIDRFALTWTAEPDALPTRISATLRMSGPTAMINSGNSAFALVPGQLDRASLAVDFGAAWDEATNTVVVEPAYVEVSDAFSLNARLRLSGVDDSVFSTEPDEALAGAAEVNLDSFDLTLTDAGLYDQKLEQAAKEQGLKPEEIRQLFAGFADLLLGQAVADRPELGPAVDAFIRFVQKPMGTLSLRVTPRNPPLPMLLIVEALNSEDPLSLVDELNVTTPAAP